MEVYTFKSIPELREALANIAFEDTKAYRAGKLPEKVTASSYISNVLLADPRIKKEIKKIRSGK